MEARAMSVTLQQGGLLRVEMLAIILDDRPEAVLSYHLWQQVSALRGDPAVVVILGETTLTLGLDMSFCLGIFAEYVAG
jgi:hypothetical protein